MAETGPLEGVRVLDASNLIAGPMATMLLGDFGADVVKIEHPTLGDQLRNHGPAKGGVPLWWLVAARNKRCITLDLSRDEGRELFLSLVKNSDIVVESFRPGTFERWNLGYRDLREVKDDIIFARVSGFGQVGPMHDRPGFGTIGEAMSGFAHRTGQPDGPPTLPPFGLADSVTGIITAFGIMTALHARNQGLGGQEVDVAIVESLLSVLTPQLVVFDQLGEVMHRTGSRSDMNAPRNLYETSDGRWIALSTSTQSTADRLFRLIGRADILDEAWFQGASSRAEHADELDSIVGRWVKEHTQEQVLWACGEAGTPAAPVYTAAEIPEDPQYKALGSVAQVLHDLLGQVRMPNVAFRLSETPGSIRWPGVDRGTHNAEVFREVGLDDADLERLRQEGVM